MRTQRPWLGLALSRQSWELPLRRRDAVLQSVLLRNADEIAARLLKPNDVVSDLRRILLSRLAQGDSNIESVARFMPSYTVDESVHRGYCWLTDQS